MEWLLANPQINSTFGSLGAVVDEVYLVSEDCLVNLEEIIGKLAVEDTTLRTFRRAIGFGQNVKNDIVPLLVHAKDSKILDPTIRLLVNLTVPAECLLPVDLVSKSEIGRHTIFELNKLLITSKEAFVDWKTTKAVIDYMKSILEKDSKLSVQNCDSINNCLLLLRNILHVPEVNTPGETKPAHSTSLQNQILWNLFTQSVDKLLIYLMSCPQRAFWAVTMAQLVALMYKDQHISTLQKLLSFWFESTLSESSEDNESNTSPPQQCSGDSSPMLTSDPTSDSSDNGSSKMNTSISKDPSEAEQVSRMGTEFPTQIIVARAIKSHQIYHQTMGTTCAAKHPTQPAHPHDPKAPLVTTNSPPGVENSTVSPKLPSDLHAFQSPFQVQPKLATSTSSPTGAPASKVDTSPKTSPSPPTTPSPAISCKDLSDDPKSPSSGQESTGPSSTTGIKNQASLSETSDCGYGTQAEKESISTSSNEDDVPNQKPQHQKPPPNQKQRFNAANKQRNPAAVPDKKELRRKKLVKRSKSNIITMKGLIHHVPTDDDISNILKEFTVDFLLKGYGFLVQELHAQLLSDLQVQIDTSHFFWLVTYFLKFASQLELDIEHVNTVLSYDIVSYLTYEGVMLCEQLEQLTRVAQNDIKPCLRRIHLVVTAIREFLQALETYKKSSHLTKEDRELLKTLQLQIGSTDDLKCLFVLLLRCYNPSLQSKQYLQDLIVTNHSLLLLLDGIRDIPGANVTDMLSHIRQFATVEIMHQYGLMLEDFRENGAFVNDCIFTMMHHVGGDLGLMNVLFQPNILKTFSLIWETEYEICDDWSDLIEYVIHKFINTPQPSPLTLTSTLPDLSSQLLSSNLMSTWTQEDKDSLQWYYVQCKQSKCMVADILRLFEENGNQQKTRVSIIEQLWEQDIVTLSQYDELMKLENPDYERNVQTPGFSVASAKSEKMDDDNRPSSKAVDDIQVLRDRLFKENKGKLVVWLQKSLLDCCFVKLNLLSGTVVVMEPVPYHCILQKKSIPIVPWNLEQFNVLSYQPFVLLLHKLGFHLPADARKMFVRIPEFWTAEILYNIALKLGPLEKSIIKFDLKHLNKALSMEKQTKSEPFPVSDGVIKPDIYGTLARSNKSNPVRSGYTPDVTTNWLQVVMRNKAAAESASSTRAMEIPVTPQVIVSTGAALHPSNGNTGGGKPASHPKLAHDLSIIVEAASNDELPVGEEDDDDELDRSDGPALAGHDVVSDCETASVASDLTRMYVSDEEDKHDIVPQIL
ncbi:protein timeless isoform X11 [Culex pipiens pallens]|uniref:protein timeless isoform X11 n=1 Tax=Culex pipiens pallens TaxID=42434 RepID=UPI001953EF85|nr:protein timeless isoform X11 [Culex pipiens pallens]